MNLAARVTQLEIEVDTLKERIRALLIVMEIRLDQESTLGTNGRGSQEDVRDTETIPQEKEVQNEVERWLIYSGERLANRFGQERD